jgi:PilZ domain
MMTEDRVMIDKRQFHRVQLLSKTILSNNDSTYQGHLENISMTGALIRLDHGIVMPLGREYVLTVIIDGEDAPLQLNVEIVHVSFTMAGIKFVSFKADTGTRLAKLIERFSLEPDVVMAEQERIRRLFDRYFQEE